MESAQQEILLQMRRNIIDDIDVDNGIISPLISEYILREEDVNRIHSGNDRRERAQILLDILPRCGTHAFEVFHQSLKHHYEWLSEDIDKLLGNYELEINGVKYYGLPNIPPISPLTVTREEKVGQLKAALQQLEPKGYVALHGMKGFGKSCLIASALKDMRLVKDLFSNKVYWIKFGYERSIDEEILIQLTTLYHNVKNLEIHPESFTALQKDPLIRFLKHHFSKSDNRNTLLILDDVSNEKIINIFDFECKTVVLTVDIDVLRGRRPKIIEMNDGFTEAETLGLFANILNIDVDELPREAKKIHEECKGMPLLIAMFAAQFEEFKHDMRIHHDRWRYYLRSLKKKDATNKVIREFLEKQEAIFDMCIEQLEPDLKKQYEDLAVFSEDVNITPKTLEILWEREVFKVEELMLDLCHKSLAAKQWNKDLKTYIYGVHDLLLCHLRKKLTQDELTQMHKSVIEKYRKYCDNDFSKLPNDNYIYLYIGHHLDQAKLLSEFPRLYLDFDFIQAKIKHTGLSDLLLDLKKYRKYITNNYNEEYEARVYDMERFLQEQAGIIAEHRRKECLDIVQIAMNHPYQAYVAQNARTLASERQKYLYLSHLQKLEHTNVPLSEEIATGICTTSFTDDPNSILTGSTSGKITLWNCEKKKQVVFNGHSSKCSIKKIIISEGGDCFLSLSDTGIIKLFLLYNDEMFDQNHIHVDSPRQKQSCWAGFFTNANDQDDSLVEFSVKNETILDMAFVYGDDFVAACTDKATIQIWDRRGTTVSVLKDSRVEFITKIAFTTQGSLLHIMDEAKGASLVYSNWGNEYSIYTYITAYGLQLQGKRIIFFHHVPEHDNSLMIVTEDKAIYIKWFHSGNDQIHNFKKQVRAYVENDAITYVCATITYDGEYLIVADSGGFINVWNTDTGYQPVATYKGRVTSLDTYWLKEEGYHIICGNEKNMLHRWKLPVQESGVLVRKSLFDAVVQSYDEMDIIVKENHANKFVVSYGEDTMAEFESADGKILSLQLSSDGNKVLYTTEKDTAALFYVETGKTITIFKLPHPIKFLKILNIQGNDIIVCRETDNNLKIWQNIKVAFIVENTGRVVCLHKLNDNHVITITQNGIVVIWNIDLTWYPISRIGVPNLSNAPILFSCLSHNKTYLAVLREPQTLILYTFHENTTVLPTYIQIKFYFTHTFTQKVTYCDISQNEQYIAVGLETGQISIIDMESQREIQQLSFHSNPITQLSWAPNVVGAPILLSLTNDELVWWNIALANNESSVKRRSRSGLMHSISTPSFTTSTPSTSQLRSSQSVDTNVSNLQYEEPSTNSENSVNDVSTYWVNKVGKDPRLPALLAVVELPPSRIAKVCISPDFTKFVTVDIYGSVSTFKLFGYTV